MKRYRTVFAYLLSLALMASGCGGSSGGNGNSAGGGGSDKPLAPASELVSKADAEKVLGVTVRLDAEEASEDKTSCFYGGTNVERGNPSSLSANLIKTSTEDLAKTSFESMSEQGERMGKVEPIASMGDEARLASGSPATLAIYVRKGKTVLYLTAVGNASEKPSRSELTSLAKRIVAQL